MSREHPPTITLLGAWQGKVGDPARSFQGSVTQSEHPGVEVARDAHVKFESSGQRVSGASEHGTYILTLGQRRMPLMSFTCHAASTTGPEGHDDTLETVWLAVPLTGAGQLD